MEKHEVVSRERWLESRKALLAKEKTFTRLRDELSEARRRLPWRSVDTAYVFDGPDGRESLADLFAGRSQLIVYHFMFDPAWEAGCRSCSFWADNFDPIIVHLNQRDASVAAISRAPLDKLQAFRRRMGWHFIWLSSGANNFNRDYHVSFGPEELAGGEVEYNYRRRKTTMTELPGISVFAKGEAGEVFHTYSCYERGLDMMNAAYHYLDLLPKGRDEAGQGQAWVRHHDRYAG